MGAEYARKDTLGSRKEPTAAAFIWGVGYSFLDPTEMVGALGKEGPSEAPKKINKRED